MLCFNVKSKINQIRNSSMKARKKIIASKLVMQIGPISPELFAKTENPDPWGHVKDCWKVWWATSATTPNDTDISPHLALCFLKLILSDYAQFQLRWFPSQLLSEVKVPCSENLLAGYRWNYWGADLRVIYSSKLVPSLRETFHPPQLRTIGPSICKHVYDGDLTAKGWGFLGPHDIDNDPNFNPTNSMIQQWIEAG